MPRIIGRYWIMDDGSKVPLIAGGSDGDEADLESLKAALEKANAEAAARRHELKKYDGIDPDEYRRLKEAVRKAEEEQMKAEGKFEELKERIESEWRQKLEQVESKYKELESRYHKVAIDERLVAAFAKAGAVAPEEAAALTRQMAALDDSGVYVVGDDGKTPLVKDGKRVSLEEFAQQWLEQRPHHMKAGPSGSGAPGGKGDPKGDVIKRSEFESMDPMQRAQVIKGGAKVVDG